MPRLLRFLLVGAVVAAVVYGIGRLNPWGTLGVENMRALVASAGVLAPLLFMGIFVAGFFLPGPEILLAALGAVLFGRVHGFVYSYVASLIGTTATFLLVRYTAQAYMQRALHDRVPWLRNFDQRLARHGLRTVITLRLMLFLAPPLNWALGGSRVPTRDYVLGTALGILPGLFLTTYLADAITQAESMSQLATVEILLPAGAVLLFVIVAVLVGRRLLGSAAEVGSGR